MHVLTTNNNVEFIWFDQSTQKVEGKCAIDFTVRDSDRRRKNEHLEQTERA